MGRLLLHEILSRRGTILGWGIGLAFFGTLYTGVYPEIAEQMEGFADIAIYQALGISVASFEGYLASTVIMFLSIILGVYSVVAGTGARAGEEDSGTLELLVTTRLPRWQIVTAKALALAVVMALILLIGSLGVTLTFNAILDQVDTTVTAVGVFRAVLAAWPLSMALTMFALWMGALLPTRRAALMVGIFLFLASYFGENMGSMVEVLESIRPLSIFSYHDTSPDILTDGLQAGNVAVLLGVALLCFALALLSFERRNLTVGAWPWQRARAIRG